MISCKLRNIFFCWKNDQHDQWNVLNLMTYNFGMKNNLEQGPFKRFPKLCLQSTSASVDVFCSPPPAGIWCRSSASRCSRRTRSSWRCWSGAARVASVRVTLQHWPALSSRTSSSGVRRAGCGTMLRRGVDGGPRPADPLHPEDAEGCVRTAVPRRLTWVIRYTPGGGGGGGQYHLSPSASVEVHDWMAFSVFGDPHCTVSAGEYGVPTPRCQGRPPYDNRRRDRAVYGEAISIYRAGMRAGMWAGMVCRAGRPTADFIPYQCRSSSESYRRLKQLWTAPQYSLGKCLTVGDPAV